MGDPPVRKIRNRRVQKLRRKRARVRRTPPVRKGKPADPQEVPGGEPSAPRLCVAPQAMSKTSETAFRTAFSPAHARARLERTSQSRWASPSTAYILLSSRHSYHCLERRSLLLYPQSDNYLRGQQLPHLLRFRASVDARGLLGHSDGTPYFQ